MHPINAHAADSASAVLEGQSRGPSGEFEHERSLEITAEQEFVIELLKEGHNVFVTGPGGVGKSFLVRKVLETFRHANECRFDEVSHKRVCLTASTGISAVQLGGITINSFAGIDRGDHTPDSYITTLTRTSKRVRALRRIIRTQLLILDEVSLISAGLLETLDMVLRVVRARAARSAFLLRERVKGKMTDEAESKITITDGSLIRWRELGIGDSPPTGAMKTRRHTTPEGLFDLIEEECLSKPFGGIQILVVGDFFQLPPVKPIAMLSDGYLVKPTTVTQMPVEVQEKTSSPPIAINDPHLAPGPTQTSGRIFAFETPLWSECGFRAVRLTHVFRQTDSKFVRILNSVRKGDVTHEVVRVLSTRVCDLTPDEDRFVTRLTSRRDQAARENSLKLCSLPGPLIRMVAVDGCSVSTLPHLDVDEDGDAVLADNLLKSVNVGEVVELKIGARIILLSNVDVAAGLANGVKGTVESLAASPPRALRSHHHYPRLWYSDDDKTDEEIRASLDEWYDISPGLPVVWFDSGVTRLIEPTCTAVEIEGKKVAWRAQVPLVVGYALTIHKSQGMTLSHVALDMSAIFAAGQAYVALSRCQNLNTLFLKSFQPRMIFSDTRVLQWYKSVHWSIPPSKDVLRVQPPSFFSMATVSTIEATQRNNELSVDPGIIEIPPSDDDASDSDEYCRLSALERRRAIRELLFMRKPTAVVSGSDEEDNQTGESRFEDGSLGAYTDSAGAEPYTPPRKRLRNETKSHSPVDARKLPKTPKKIFLPTLNEFNGVHRPTISSTKHQKMKDTRRLLDFAQVGSLASGDSDL